MKFRIVMSSYWVNSEDKIKYEKYGFVFEKENDKYLSNYGNWKVKTTPTIEFNNIEDLIKFNEEVGEIIIRDDYCDTGKVIEIYNDYRE